MTVSIPSQRRPIPRPQLVGNDLAVLDRRAGEYVAEVKWDGWRALVDTSTGRLVSRHGTDLTAAFPELHEAAVHLGDLVLDGELVCLGTDQRPNFEMVSARGVIGSSRAAARAAMARPACLVVWDVLRVGHEDVTSFPWTARRAVLEDLGLSHDPCAGGIAMTTVYDDVPALLQATFDLALEGVVAKARSAPYSPGARPNTWVKLKHGHHRDVLRDRRAWRRTS